MTTAARGGALSAPLEAVALATTGRTIDQAHILSVNLASSGADLTSATQADAEAGNTLCWVDGELLAYATANLTGPNAYDLAYLVRGLYGTENKTYPHAAGAPFARLDAGIVRIPYNEARIGQTIYLKFVSFNIWGGGEQSLADVEPHLYTLQGVGKPTGLSLNKMGLVVKYDDIAPSLLDRLHLDPALAADAALAALMGEIVDRDRQTKEARAAGAAASAAITETRTVAASDIAALAASAVRLTAADETGTAAVEFKALASADAVTAGLAASWSVQVSAAPNGANPVACGLRLEVLPSGAGRVVVDAASFYVLNGVQRLTVFSANADGTLTLGGVTKVASIIKSLATVASGDPVMELDFVNGRLTISQGS